MSETTRKLRKFGEGCEGHKLIDWYHMYLGMELAADAIEAVEAQVAEAVARVAALEKRTVAQIPQECPACTGEDAGTARGGTGAAARSVPNAEGSPAGSTSPPASSAVTAPRGFKKGDVVRTGGLSPFDAVVVEVREPQRENWNVTIKSDRGTYEWHGPDLTLVRAAAAPEAPAEDAGLDAHWLRAYMAGETTRLDSPLVDAVRVFVDTKTKPLHVEIEKLRAKLAAAEKAHAELLKARMECASRADGYIRERDALRAELVAIKGQYDAQTRSYNWVSAECGALRLASLTWFNAVGEPELLATAEEVTKRRKAAAKELAALKSKPRFRTRAVTEADVGEMLAHNGSFYESCRALGFRRRVEQSK